MFLSSLHHPISAQEQTALGALLCALALQPADLLACRLARALLQRAVQTRVLAVVAATGAPSVTICPCCLRRLPEFEELVSERAAELRDECDERVFDREGDLVVEQDAAVLLRFENHRSLANLRYMGALPIPSEKIGRHVYYRIADLAAFQVHRKTL